MYNHEKTIQAIAEQVGFERSYGIELAPSLLTSKTGITYNQGHALVGYKNMLSAIEEVAPSAYPEHSTAMKYARWEVVRQGQDLFQATESLSPGTFASQAWEKTNQVSIVLTALRNAAAAEVLSAVMTRKQLAGKGKAVWENLRLFEGPGALVDAIAKENRLVGWAIDLKGAKMKDLAVRVHALGLQLTQRQDALPIYVYHSSRTAPVLTTTLANVAGGGFSWHELGTLLGEGVADTAPGGTWYICYRESELEGHAVSNKNYKWDRAPCASCSMYNVQAHQKWGHYLAVHPFSVREDLLEGDQMWDTAHNRYNYATNYGLNMALTLECDITTTVIRTAAMFAEAQKLATVEKILQLFVANTRNNADAEKMRQLADYELNNRENHTDGLTKKKERVLEALDFNLSGLSPMCLPGRDTRLSREAM